MADATAGALTPGTREKLTTASATGRMLLAMVALWLDREVGPAMAALNDDLRGIGDTEAATVQRALRGAGDPDTLAQAMLDLLDAVGTVDLLNAEAWARVRELAGEWVGGG